MDEPAGSPELEVKKEGNPMAMSLKIAALWRSAIPTLREALGLGRIGKKWAVREHHHRQTEFHLRPFVILEATNGEEERRMQLRNVGNGTAVEISIRGGALSFSPLPSTLCSGEAFRLRDGSAADDRRGSAGTTTDPNDLFPLLWPAGDTLEPGLPSPSGAAVEVTILFRNVEGAPYFVIERVAHGRLEIVDWGRR
jgi:hypothetical protein